jgi:hypothetical protein
MDNRLEQDALIEDALKSYELVEMPQNITANVMARIQKDIRPKLVTWNDFVLSFVIALCIGALFFTVRNLPPILFAKLRIQGILLYQDFLVNANWFVPTLFFSMAGMLLVIAFFYFQKRLKI